MRTTGYDIHLLRPGKGIKMGGVSFNLPYSFIAHSDGDVVFHALIDALIGAAAYRGDIGTLFPQTKTWERADSLKLSSRQSL